MLPIRWSQFGLILRGGWLFGKNKESFGHNGWDGSLGFADPVLGIGVAYTTNNINPTISSHQRIINLLKKILRNYLKIFFGGEKGIRTLDTFNSIHAFQAGAFNHSAISPHKKL
jgi:CubicO group peptidase (beta-lactamase class C family)